MIIFKKKRYWWWVIGTGIALSGVALVRLLAPEYPPGMTRIAIGATGHAVIIFGLFSLTFATRRDE